MENSNSPVEKPKKIKLDFKDSKYATGRRKRSIAKVWIKKGNGNIHVNGMKMNEYFKRPVHQIIVTRPLEISQVLSERRRFIWPSRSNYTWYIQGINCTRRELEEKP